MKELRGYERQVQEIDDLQIDHDELSLYHTFYIEKEVTEKELREAYEHTDKKLQKLLLKKYMGKPEDKYDAVVEIHSGAGGRESQDWAFMLFRMYTLWATQKKYTLCQVNYQVGEEGGVKSATLEIKAPYAYGYLKAETGVHRLVRISPFDANARRHTSFASVNVFPLVDDSININIDLTKISWESFRSGGPGGQNTNKVETAVRLRYEDVIVTCQQERSQHQNKEKALKILRSRLYQKEIEKQHRAKKVLMSSQKQISFGSQVRNYILHPYKLLKDLVSGYQSSQVMRILDGDLDEMLAAKLSMKHTS